MMQSVSRVAQALTVAGSDSGGGAGIQADLKTFQMRGVFGMSALTAVTAQNTLGVHDIHLIPTATIAAQLDAIAADFQAAACKIGMLGTVEIIECVAEKLKQHTFGRCVLDPVMIAKGGASLLQDNAVRALEKLLPLADIITPNLPEAEALSGIAIYSDEDIKRAAAALQKAGAKNVVIKGGHSEDSASPTCRDWLFGSNGEVAVLESPRHPTRQTHGTGCTFSACIAAELAKGAALSAAVHTAKQFISAAVSAPLNIGHGHGPTNHWAFAAQAMPLPVPSFTSEPL